MQKKRIFSVLISRPLRNNTWVDSARKPEHARLKKSLPGGGEVHLPTFKERERHLCRRLLRRFQTRRGRKGWWKEEHSEMVRMLSIRIGYNACGCRLTLGKGGGVGLAP